MVNHHYISMFDKSIWTEGVDAYDCKMLYMHKNIVAIWLTKEYNVNKNRIINNKIIRGGFYMAILAKPVDKVPVIRVNDKKRFEEAFNNAKPSRELIESCEKAGKLFERKK